MKNFQKGFVPVLIALIVVVVIGGGYVLVSQKSKVESQKDKALKEEKKAEEMKTGETADWKTYRNEKYGFEFQYPSDWYPYPNGDAVLLIKSKELPKIGDTEGYAYGEQIIVSVSELNGVWGEKISVAEYIKGFDPGIISKNEVTINGLSMVRIERSEEEANANTLHYLYFKNDKVFSFYLYPLDYGFSSNLYNKNVKDFEKLISTFRFTEPTPKVDISNWKMYRNEKYGFDVNYPPVLVPPNCGGEGGGCVFNPVDENATDYYIVIYYGPNPNIYHSKEGELWADPTSVVTVSGRQVYWRYDGDGDPEENLLHGAGFTCSALWDCNLTRQYHALIIVPDNDSFYDAHNIHTIEFSGKDVRDKERYKKIINAFLSTFKFTK